MSIIKDFIVKSGLQVQSTAASTSATTGALIVNGGAGFGGAVFVAGTGTFGTVLPGVGSTSTANGQTLKIAAGGISVTGDSFFNGSVGTNGQVYLTNTTNAVSTNSGALQLLGGAAIAKDLWVGQNIYLAGAGVITTATIGIYGVASITAGTDTAVSSATGAVTLWNTSNLQSVTDRGAATTNAISITNGTQASNTNSGALIVQGGVAVWAGLQVGGSGTFGGNGSFSGTLSVTNTGTFNNATDSTGLGSGSVIIAGGLSVAKNIYSLNQRIVGTGASVTTTATNALAVTAGGLGVSGTALIGGDTVIKSVTNGTSTSTGQALLVSGGVGVAGSLYAGKAITVDATAASTVGAGSLQVAGGGYFGKNVVISSTDSSAVTTSANALYVAGSVGIDKNLYVGGEIIAQKLTIQYTTITTTIVETDDVMLTFNDSQAVSTSTGALQVPYGGAGIGRQLYVGGDVNFAQDLVVVGNISFGSGTTASGSFGVFYGDVYGSNALYAGVSSYTPLPATTLQLTANTGTYAQTNFQNKSSAAFASADYILTSDDGTDSSNYADFGIASSGFDYPDFSIIKAHDAYMYGHGGDLILATGEVGKKIEIWTGGTASTSTGITLPSTHVGSHVANFVDQGLRLLVPTVSTDSNTGALVVTGGVGVGGALNVAGALKVTGQIIGTVTNATTATNLAGGSYGSIPYQFGTGTTAFIGIGTSGYVLTSNGTTATWVDPAASSSNTATNALNVLVTSTNVSSNFNLSFVNTLNGLSAVYGDTTLLFNPNTDVLTVNGTTESTTSTDGTLVIAGGVGIAKNVTVKGSLTQYGVHAIVNSTAASSTITGALTVGGGVGIGGSVYAGSIFDTGNRVITTVTPAAGAGIAITGVTSSGPTASFTVQNFGVTSLAGTTYIGVSSNTGSVTLTNLGVQTLTAGTDTAVSSSTGTVTVWDVSTLQTVTGRGAVTTNAITINNSTNATTTGSGALIVTGGIGVSRDVLVGGTISRRGDVNATGWLSNGIGITAPSATYTDTSLTGAQGTATIHMLATPTLAASGGTPTYSNAATLFVGGAPIAGTGATITNPWAVLVGNGNVKIAGGTISNATNTGALQVVGGVGIGGALVAGGSITAGTTVAGSVVNGFASNNSLIASYTSAAIVTTATTNLDVWSTSTYRTARYSIQLVDTGFTPNRVHFTEIVLLHDGSANVYKSEYGIVNNLGELGTFDATVTGSGVQLTFTPTLTPTALVVKAFRTSITA